jgi:hypothetical protein
MVESTPDMTKDLGLQNRDRGTIPSSSIRIDLYFAKWGNKSVRSPSLENILPPECHMQDNLKLISDFHTGSLF